VCSVCSVVTKNGIATQTQDHLPNRVGLLHQLVDHFARHKLVDLHRTDLSENGWIRLLTPIKTSDNHAMHPRNETWIIEAGDAVIQYFDRFDAMIDQIRRSFAASDSDRK